MRQNKQYSYDEMSRILQAYEANTPIEQIATESDRTTDGIESVIWSFNRFKANKAKHLSMKWINHFKQYLSSNGSTAEALRAQVKEDVVQNQESNLNNETESLLQEVENNWKMTLESIAKLVEHEAEARSKKKIEAVNQELSELREFKQEASDSNIAGTLRKTLMSL